MTNFKKPSYLQKIPNYTTVDMLTFKHLSTLILVTVISGFLAKNRKEKQEQRKHFWEDICVTRVFAVLWIPVHIAYVILKACGLRLTTKAMRDIRAIRATRAR